MRGTATLFLCVALLAQSPPVSSAQELYSQGTEKSSSFGVGLGLSSLFVPLAMIATGSESAPLAAAYVWLVGPLPGLVYAGETGRGLKGVGVRAGIFASTVLLVAGAASNTGDSRVAGAIAVGGILGTVISWGADIAAIPGAVRRSNSVGISPMVGAEGRVGAQVQLLW
jgi:hypothetical protein